MNLIDILKPLRSHAGKVRTAGLDDATVLRLADRFPELVAAAHAAVEQYTAMRAEFAELLDIDEQAQIEAVQAGFVNFYSEDAVNPYVALAARGPWVVTLKGAVIHDSGGYGMIGFGHTPQAGDRHHGQAAGDGQRHDPVAVAAARRARAAQARSATRSATARTRASCA